MAQPPRFLKALWLSVTRFIANLFNRSPAAALPTPVTAKCAEPASGTVTRQRSIGTRVKEPTPLKRPSSAASSPVSSATTCRSASPNHTPHVFHPPPSPFPSISLSAIFATPPLLESPCLASGVDIGPNVPSLTPFASPSPFHASHAPSTPSFRSLHSRSPCTPSPPVMVRVDRSTISPTTMSDGSLEVISLGDRRGFLGSPIMVADIARLPSPWSPLGNTTPSSVWMSVNGMLMDAAGPVDDNPPDDSGAPKLPIITASGISASLCSSSSALDALGISVFVDLDDVRNALSAQGNNLDARQDPTGLPKSNQVRHENLPMFVTQTPQTPRKRPDTFPSVTKSHPPNQTNSARATKCLSTPLAELEKVEINHVHSLTSISSMAYELRMGLFADGRSRTIENIISLLDQASPESISPQDDAKQPVEAAC